MKHIILFDDEYRDKLLPLVYTRPVSDLRVGILRIFEKWEYELDAHASFITQDYLSEKFQIEINDDNLIINGALLPNAEMVALIGQLDPSEAILYNDRLIAARLNRHQFDQLINDEAIETLIGIELDEESKLNFIDNTWDIFAKNGAEIEIDFNRIVKSRVSEQLPDHVMQFGSHPIFIESGAKIRPCIFNSEEGPIYIGKNAEIMEQSVIRGPFSLGDESVLKIGTKVYSGSTIGPYSKVGGEINNVVLHSYSNKGHDGFLGNAAIGSWCNLGADTNNSNLKNNYASVKLWSYPEGRFINTGLQFCGLVMGDHSKCGINTMFNTGTVIGVNANIFGSGFPRNFIPSFSWGGSTGYKTFQIDKALETAEIMMKRRSIDLNAVEKSILENVFKISSEYRRWDNVSKTES